MLVGSCRSWTGLCCPWGCLPGAPGLHQLLSLLVFRWERVEKNLIMLRTKAYPFHIESLVLAVKPRGFAVSHFPPV